MSIHRASMAGAVLIRLRYMPPQSLEMAAPDSRDHFGRFPLHRVSQGGFMAKSALEIARLLINSGADMNVTDDEGCASLHAAVESGVS